MCALTIDIRHCVGQFDVSAFQVEKKLRDVKYEIDHGIYAKPQRLTVDSWYSTWLKEYRVNIARETTIISNEKSYKHIKQEIGNMKLQAVRPEHLGHSTVDLTMDIYTHVTAELEREEIKKIESQF